MTSPTSPASITGTLPRLGEDNRVFHVPGEMGKYTICTSFNLLTLYDQREVRGLPVVRRMTLYPTPSVWLELVEGPRGMAASLPQILALQGKQLMGKPQGGPYDRMLATLWPAEMVDIFLCGIFHRGHLWRLPLAFWSAFADLKTERFSSADPSVRPLLEAGLKLLRLIEERESAPWPQWTGGPRGVLRCAT